MLVTLVDVEVAVSPWVGILTSLVCFQVFTESIELQLYSPKLNEDHLYQSLLGPFTSDTIYKSGLIN